MKYKVYYGTFRDPNNEAEWQARSTIEVEADSAEQAYEIAEKMLGDHEITSIRRVKVKNNPRSSYRVEDLDGIEIGTYNMEHSAREAAQKYADKYRVQVRIKRIKRPKA